MPVRPILLVILILALAFFSPALAQTIQPAQYFKTRLAANARDQKAIAEALKDIRKRGQDTLAPRPRNLAGAGAQRGCGDFGGRGPNSHLRQKDRGRKTARRRPARERAAGDTRRCASVQPVEVCRRAAGCGARTLVRLAQRPGLLDAVEYEYRRRATSPPGGRGHDPT